MAELLFSFESSLSFLPSHGGGPSGARETDVNLEAESPC